MCWTKQRLAVISMKEIPCIAQLNVFRPLIKKINNFCQTKHMYIFRNIKSISQSMLYRDMFFLNVPTEILERYWYVFVLFFVKQNLSRISVGLYI